MEKYIRESDAVQTVLEKPDMTPDEKAGIIRRLKAIPAADVIPVVRCADCEYFSEPGWCENPNTFAILTRGNTSPNWFCADGKRKDGGRADA